VPTRKLLDSVCLVDRGHDYVVVGDSVASMIGWRARELVGESVFEFLAPDAARSSRVRAMDAGEIVTDATTFLARDGERIRCSFTAQAVNGGELYVATVAPLIPQTFARAAGHDGWMTKDEAARYARCSASTLERAVHDGRLVAGGTSHRRLYRRAWLDAWLALVVVALVACCVLNVIPLPRVPLGHGGTLLRRELSHRALERHELRREAELDRRAHV
jgi:excisionase family DNA binding protein/PAS domain S-box-containing protein